MFIIEPQSSFLLLTLHDGHQSSADPRHHITQQPLSKSVDPRPANDRQKREHDILGTFRITAVFGHTQKARFIQCSTIAMRFEVDFDRAIDLVIILIFKESGLTYVR